MREGAVKGRQGPVRQLPVNQAVLRQTGVSQLLCLCLHACSDSIKANSLHLVHSPRVTGKHLAHA